MTICAEISSSVSALRAARAEILLKNEALEASNRQLAVAFETLKALDARKSEFLRIVGLLFGLDADLAAIGEG